MKKTKIDSKKDKGIKKNNDKILFETKTIIDINEFKKFHRFYTSKFKSDFSFKLVIFVLAIIAIILNIVKGNYTAVIMLVISCIIYPIILYFGLERHVKKMYTKYRRVNAVEEELCFFEKFFSSKSRFNLFEVNYDEVDAIYETKENFYIFISNTKAFILIKKNISDVDGFSKFIREKTKYCGKRK